MENKYLEEIKIKSVQYYENDSLYPDLFNKKNWQKHEHTIESVIDNSAFFYASNVKLHQIKNGDDYEDEITVLVSQATLNVAIESWSQDLTDDIKLEIIYDYNAYCLKCFKLFLSGLALGEEEGESVGQISLKLGLGRSTIYRLIKNH